MLDNSDGNNIVEEIVEYKIRKALLTDKKAVLDIIDVNHGLDYLPDYYELFLECQNMLAFVYEEGGDIIGYSAVTIVDNGNTAVYRASRVRPDRQGMGIFKKILAHVDGEMKNIGVTRRAMLRRSMPSTSFLRVNSPVAKKKHQMFQFEMERGIIEKINDVKIHCLEYLKDEYPSTIFTSNFANYLFPEGRIIVDWVPYRILEENGPMLKGKDTCIASDVGKNGDGNVSGLLTVSSYVNVANSCDLDTVCTLDIFGSDFTSINNHIGFHLSHCQQSGYRRNMINLQIFTSVEVTSATVDEAVSEFGIERLTSGPRSDLYSYMIAYERTLQIK